MLHIVQLYWDNSGGSSWVHRAEFYSFFSSFLSPALLFHSGLSSPQLTFPPLQPFILQMLAWLCGLSSQHKGLSVDEGLASAWAPASVICPRQPFTEPRGGWAWAGHGAWMAGGVGRGRGTESQLWREGQLPPFASPSLHSQNLLMQTSSNRPCFLLRRS